MAIEITNHSNEERQLVSNLPKIMGSLSLGFPSQAALQLKDTKGDFIGLQGQNPDGWWYPSILSSSVDLKKDRALEETSAVTVPAGQKVTYLLDARKALSLARAAGGGKSGAFRLRVRALIERPGGRREHVDLTSAWLRSAGFQD